MAAARLLFVLPVLGCGLLAALAAADDGAFRFVVREDSVLEWAEVGAYAAAAVAAFAVARRMRGIVRVAYAGLVVAAVAAIGEELSWGQRLFGVATPESVAGRTAGTSSTSTTWEAPSRRRGSSFSSPRSTACWLRSCCGRARSSRRDA